ncbi:cupin domain-containing protein [Microbacterium sp. P01]|uniref:cupin domain-containing protein n=1 Tax=Microbacterium sp. P01 TaxID=3366261 RepID=UPI00366B035B
MNISDIGPDPDVFDIDGATKENNNYRTVAWTGKYLQITLMAIPIGQSIGLECHPATDQFLRVVDGQGRAVMGAARDHLDSQHDVSTGWAIQVPAGTWHDVINTGTSALHLCTIYAPVHHAAGTVQRTSADAARDETSGADTAPEWTAQINSGDTGEHA